jgi:hypothetical protein
MGMYCENIISHRHIPPEHTRSRNVNTGDAGYLRKMIVSIGFVERRPICLFVALRLIMGNTHFYSKLLPEEFRLEWNGRNVKLIAHFQSSVEVQNTWSFVSTTPCAIMMWCLGRLTVFSLLLLYITLRSLIDSRSSTWTLLMRRRMDKLGEVMNWRILPSWVLRLEIW